MRRLSTFLMTACAILIAQAASPLSVLDPENMGRGVASSIELERAADGLYRLCGTMPAGTYRIVVTDENGKDHYLKANGDSKFELSDDAQVASQFEVSDAKARMQVFVHATSSHYTFKKYQPWERLYAVGSFNHWTFGHPCTKIDEDNFRWEGEISMSEGTEFKFMGTNDWIDEYGIHPYTAREALERHTHFYTGGYDNKWEIGHSGKHTFEINMFTREMKVTDPGMSTIEEMAAEGSGMRIYVRNGVLTVGTATPTEVVIFDLWGNCFGRSDCDGEVTFRLPAGIYIVNTLEETVKIAI